MVGEPHTLAIEVKSIEHDGRARGSVLAWEQPPGDHGVVDAKALVNGAVVRALGPVGETPVGLRVEVPE